ncbi:MAG: shikimate dehydrogenase [Bacteroidota bacterium]
MIIVSITGPSMKEAFAQIAASSRYADMFELRLDLIQEPPMSMLMSATNKPIVATCRPMWEGGAFDGSETERMEILEATSMLGADYVDIEWKADKTLLQEFLNRRKESKVILSHHQFENKSINVSKLYARMRAIGADVLKAAYVANDVADIRYAFDFLNLARRDKQRAVAIAMGESGEPSRILYNKYGGWATYASTEDGKNSAPGQIPASQLKQLYRADKISSKTKVYGVIGNPLNQSKGVYLHNPLFQRAKKDAVYCRFQVKDIFAFMKHVAPILSGFSVTLPHKQTVMKFADRLDSTAKGIGAVNTVVRQNGKLVATNTDAPGALDAIEKVAKVRGKRMLIVGAGGAARAIAYEAKQRGAEVLITNRNEEKAKKLAREFGLGFVRESSVQITLSDIIVNATSVGMTPHADESPVPKSILKNKIVFDAVYNPPMTKLLRDAKSVGAKIVQGTEMYLNQAALQSELYTGVKPKSETMRRILEQAKG